MHARETDEFISVDVTRVTLDIERNVRIVQAFIGDLGNTAAQGRRAVLKADNAKLAVILRAETFAGKMIHDGLDRGRRGLVVARVELFVKDGEEALGLVAR